MFHNRDLLAEEVEQRRKNAALLRNVSLLSSHHFGQCSVKRHMETSAMHKKSFANVTESTRGKHGYTETQMRDMAIIAVEVVLVNSNGTLTFVSHSLNCNVCL